VFTNLTPEHLEAHGGFENYRAAKGKLFAKLGQDPVKTIGGEAVEKIALANLASEHADYYLSFPGSRKWGFLAGDDSHLKSAVQIDERVRAEAVRCTADGCEFRIRGADFRLNLLGWFNVENATAAVAVGLAFGIPPDEAAQALAKVTVVPGRLEPVNVGQDFAVLIDYAPEPESFRKLYEAIALLERPAGSRIIHLLGSCGGGRDRDRRPTLGRLAAENADIVIVTDEDPYDDDPQQIIDEVAAGAQQAGKTDGEDLFRILDRSEAIRKAVSLAQAGDLIISTGKGAEQAICRTDGHKEPWDERKQFQEAIMAWLAEKTRACYTRLPEGGEPIGG
jgi:UDP-N-acetylmuramoyl-L-alanyl-D-glutamate--2,6-diaminopimelate ligase